MNLPAPALQRGLHILELLKDGENRSLEDISNSLGFPKSSVTRLLETLCGMDYVERDETTKRYTTRVALYPLTQRHSRFRQLIQSCLENLSAELELTTEWFTPMKDHVLLTQRCEDTSNSVRIRAQLGFRREYWTEFDALARIGQKALKRKGTKKQMNQCWVYNKGEKKTITASAVTSGIKAITDDLIAYDDEYNPNGIRRMAIGIRDADNSLFGIIAVPVHYHPKADAMRASRLKTLAAAGTKLEKKLKEI